MFPELARELSGADTRLNGTIRSLVKKAGKTVVITPSHRRLNNFIEHRLPEGMPVYRAEDVEASMAPFASAEKGVLALANRYDGIDLPDETCRMVVLDGLPIGSHLQERFLHQTLGATRILQERIRARFVQGAGRATRNPSDFAIVLVLGRELTSFCGRRDVQAATHPEIQAEIEFGLENSMNTTGADFAANIAHFLAQDETWRTEAEPVLRELRESCEKGASAGSDQLRRAASKEVLASQATWRGEWARAIELAVEVIESLAGGAETRPYQAFWNYLAACWAAVAARSGAGERYRTMSEEFTHRARAAARGTTWIDYLSPPSAITSPLDDAIDSVDAVAAHQIAKLAATTRQATFDRLTSEVIEGLAQAAASKYEMALVGLGQLLGAEGSFKPPNQARADAIWPFADALWVAWEAKSEEEPGLEVSAQTVRQANTHLTATAADLSAEIPAGSFTLIATQRSGLHPAAEGLKAENVYIVSIDAIKAFAEDLVRAHRALRSRALGSDQDELFGLALEELRRRKCLPSTLLTRLVRAELVTE